VHGSRVLGCLDHFSLLLEEFTHQLRQLGEATLGA
jgi:hypothetical protein